MVTTPAMYESQRWITTSFPYYRLRLSFIRCGMNASFMWLIPSFQLTCCPSVWVNGDWGELGSETENHNSSEKSQNTRESRPCSLFSQSSARILCLPTPIFLTGRAGSKCEIDSLGGCHRAPPRSYPFKLSRTHRAG